MSGIQMRRLMVNLLLVLLVGGLGYAAWWFVNKPKQGPETLFSESLDSINLITLERDSKVEAAAKIRFEQQDGHWFMVEPEKVAANDIRLRQLFTFLNEPVVSSYESAGKDLTQFGLQPGNVTLRFNDQQYVLGTNNAVSNNRYVLHDNKVKLVSESIYGSVTGDWVNFVALQLVPKAKKVKSVVLPSAYKKVGGLEDSWQNADAIRLEPFNAATLDKDIPKVSLTLDDGSQLSFLILEKSDELVLAQPDRGISYFIPETQASYLLPVTEDDDDIGGETESADKLSLDN